MAKITIHKRPPEETSLAQFPQDIENLYEQIRNRALALFHERGSTPGRELDDWIRAERELLCVPQSELVEHETEYSMAVSVPGLEASQIEVSASPDRVVVKADSAQKREHRGGRVHFSELAGRQLYRSIRFPEPIDVDKISANLKNGILTIKASKQQASAEAPPKKAARARQSRAKEQKA